MGGEKTLQKRWTRPAAGSPPHGRGKALALGMTCSSLRITPAWAGKSLLPVRIGSTHEDHPRMGGEKNIQWFLPEGHGGSPPHGRGKVCGGMNRIFHMGITPAWAGKSILTIQHSEVNQDHPRMGGEKMFFKPGRSMYPGSPPHGRGKVNLRTALKLVGGITPAWAGKSGVVAPVQSTAGDHPRMGGEKTKKIP